MYKFPHDGISDSAEVPKGAGTYLKIDNVRIGEYRNANVCHSKCAQYRIPNVCCHKSAHK